MKYEREADRIMQAITDSAVPTAMRVTKRFKHLSASQIIEILSRHVSEERQARIRHVVSGRTRRIVPVIEGVLNSGNVSAVLRTTEALGLQGAHIITGEAPFKHSRRTTQGADKWLDLHVWDGVQPCVNHLREDGYQIAVAIPDEGAVSIEKIDFSLPTALVFGNELDGISETLAREADIACVIPGTGFVQSFNISVAAAIALYVARRRLDAVPAKGGEFTAEERADLMAEFFYRAVAHADRILEQSR